MCADQVNRPKPSPESLLKACEEIKIEVNHACYVGDTRIDMEAAQAAGMPGLLALWGYWQSLKYDVNDWAATEMFYAPEEMLTWLHALEK